MRSWRAGSAVAVTGKTPSRVLGTMAERTKAGRRETAPEAA